MILLLNRMLPIPCRYQAIIWIGLISNYQLHLENRWYDPAFVS